MISWVLLCYSGLSTQKWGIPVTEMLRNGLSNAKCTSPTVNISPSLYRKLQSENHSFARHREKRCQARTVPWRPTHFVPIQKNQRIIGHCDKIILHSFVQKHLRFSSSMWRAIRSIWLVPNSRVQSLILGSDYKQFPFYYENERNTRSFSPLLWSVCDG